MKPENRHPTHGTAEPTPFRTVEQMNEQLREMKSELRPMRLFVLPMHIPMSRTDYEARPLPGAELVSDLGGKVIVRLAGPKPPKRVRARSKEKQHESAMAYYLDGLPPEKDVPAHRARKGISELENVGDFVQISIVAEYALARLLTHARIGNKEAQAQFVSVVLKCTEALSEMTKTKPKDLVWLASHAARWPLMKSTRAESSDPDYLLRAIKLASARPVNFSKLAKWRDDYAAFVAGELQEYIQQIRDGESKRGLFADGKVRAYKKVFPPLRKDTAPRLWHFARQILLRSYPHPSEVPELAQICTAPSWQTPRSRKDQGILNAIEARFLAMAKAA